MNVQNQAVVLEEEYEVRRQLLSHRDALILCVGAEINTLDFKRDEGFFC